MARRQIGTGTTDSTGKITVSYTGTGAGKLQLVAVQGNLVSETFTLYDCIYYHNGVTNPFENSYVANNCTVTLDSTGATITATSGQVGTFFANKEGTGVNVFDWEPPFTFEILLVESDSTVDIQLYDNTYNAVRSYTNLGLTGTLDKIRIVNDGTSIKYFVNGTEKTDQEFNYSMGTCRVGLRTNNGSLKFKDFMIY